MSRYETMDSLQGMFVDDNGMVLNDEGVVGRLNAYEHLAECVRGLELNESGVGFRVSVETMNDLSRALAALKPKTEPELLNDLLEAAEKLAHTVGHKQTEDGQAVCSALCSYGQAKAAHEAVRGKS